MAIDDSFVGKLMGVDIMMYDKESEHQQLLDYALKFKAVAGREPHILKVNL